MTNEDHIKYAVVTGAASGIGKGVSEILLSKGITVFALDKQTLKIPNAICIMCDISSETDLSNALKCILGYTQKIDYLVLSAGTLCLNNRMLLEDMTMEEWSYVLNVNLTGTMLSLRTFIPLLKNNNGGSIVTYSSEQTLHPIPKSAPYLASKAGIEALTKLAAVEYVSSKIRVNCIRAAAVDTNFLVSLVDSPEIRQKMRNDMDLRMPYGIISSYDMAIWTWNLLSESSGKITGQIITIDSGILL